MRQIYAFRKLLLVTLMGAASAVNGQIHPLAYGPVANLGGSGTASGSNWYKDYVGRRVTVVTPSSVSGDKQNIEATIGTATSEWPDIHDTDLINIPVVMPPVTDSYAVTAFAAGSMTGKICVLWRGPISAPTTFTQKAYDAQNAGALACIIINEYPGQGPIGPGYSTGVGTVKIPVYVIGNLDGIALATKYDALGGVGVNMTITHWGQNLNQDLGFVPQGYSIWHDNVIPANQLASSGNPMAYYGLDGAFIVNFGLNPATNVQVSDSLSFTAAEGGATTVLHTGVSPTLTTFNPIDSIYAMFSNTEYTIAPPAGNGTFNLTYKILSTETDQYPGDNTVSYSFYTSDSVYSKGRYDLVNRQPTSSNYLQFGTTTDFLWGNMYYVAHGGAAISSVQFSIANKNNVFGQIGSGPMNIFVFKWVDGDPTNITGNVPDSIVENGELTPVALAAYPFANPSDTSELTFTQIMGDPSSGLPGSPILLADNTWYYVAVEVIGGYYLGCDGFLSSYPRVYGRFHSSNHNFEYPGIQWGGDYNSGSTSMTGNYAQGNAPCAGSQTSLIKSVDSFNFAGMKGLIPSVALIVNNNPTAVDHTGVQNVSKPFANVVLSPNPAKDVLNVSLALDKPSATVTYTIIDGLARFVSKEVHNNVQNENYSISTSNLASGSYFLVINANDQAMVKKFVVVK